MCTCYAQRGMDFGFANKIMNYIQLIFLYFMWKKFDLCAELCFSVNLTEGISVKSVWKPL